MTLSPFEFTDYKTFIKAWLNAQPKAGHGLKAVIAQQTQCSPVYVSHVLNGDAHFSLEQIEPLKTMFALSFEEFDFLVLLLERDRAGTVNLRKYFGEKIERVLSERKQLKNRLKNEVPLSAEIQTTYFSHWLYSAVHMATTIKDMTDAKVIAQKLGVREVIVKDTLQFLLESQIIQATKKGYEPGTKRFHLAHDSNLIYRHHNNWRLQAMRIMEQKRDENLHYSSVVSISQEDFQHIRESLLTAIEKNKAVIKDSKEQIVASLCLDFFKVSADELA